MWYYVKNDTFLQRSSGGGHKYIDKIRNAAGTGWRYIYDTGQKIKNKLDKATGKHQEKVYNKLKTRSDKSIANHTNERFRTIKSNVRNKNLIPKLLEEGADSSIGQKIDKKLENRYKRMDKNIDRRNIARLNKTIDASLEYRKTPLYKIKKKIKGSIK